VLQAGVALGRAARSGRPERRPRGCHCGRQDRGSTPVGFRSVPLGRSGGRVFAVGRWQWRAGQACSAGAGGELMGLGVAGLHHDTTRYHFMSTTGCFTARATQPACQHGSPKNSREASPPLRATGTPRQEDSLLPGHTPVTLLSHIQRDKGQREQVTVPADAEPSANLHRQFPPVPSPTSMARARQPDLRDENR